MDLLLIRKLAVFDHLPDAELQALATAPIRTALVRADQDLVEQSDPDTECCLLLDGFGARYNVLAGGQRQITAFHLGGDFVNLDSLLLDPVDHSVLALTNCLCGFVRHSYLREISERHPHLGRLLWLNTLVDSATHRQWLVAMGRRSSRDHLAHLLCEFYLRLEAVGLASDHKFILPITQADVGDAMGISFVHVNRVLRELRDADLVTWQQGVVTITDWQGLLTISEFDASYLNLETRPR